MKLAFIILAHRNPEQLQLLTDKLTGAGADVFVHIDKKSGDLFDGFIRSNGNNQKLHIYSRYKIYWGSYNQIKATFYLLRLALAHSDFDFVRLLSGQDLPLRPVRDFAEFLSAHQKNSFISYSRVPDQTGWAGRGGLDRVELFWITGFPKWCAFFFNKFNAALHLIQHKTGLRRKVPGNLYGGANWFTLNREMANYVSEKLTSETGLLKRYRNTRCADEIILQTILLNSPFRDRVINSVLCFIDWQTGPEYPRTFTVDDLGRLTDSGEFFARKFDAEKDNEVIKQVLRNA